MHTTRFTWAALALSLLLPAVARAQDTSAYEARRSEAQRALQQAQSELNDIRNQRLQVQARVENAIAQSLQQRARQLAQSDEQTALQQLDAMLIASQNSLLEQRDRIAALGDALRRRTGAVLVVLLRADSSESQTLASVQLQVNNSLIGTREYTAAANGALQRGAVDELYRSDVIPAAYNVQVQVSVNNQSVPGILEVSVSAETVTYVQFTVRNGQVTTTTWTTRGNAP